jgi:prevent-host-death family protein
MTIVGVHEAKTHLSALLRRVAGGEAIEIHSGGRPVARLVPIIEPARRTLGTDVGVFEVPDDFDAPLPADVMAGFE